MSLIKKLILLLIFFIVLNIFSIFEFDYKSYLSDNESLSTLTSKNDEKDFLNQLNDFKNRVFSSFADEKKEVKALNLELIKKDGLIEMSGSFANENDAKKIADILNINREGNFQFDTQSLIEESLLDDLVLLVTPLKDYFTDNSKLTVLNNQVFLSGELIEKVNLNEKFKMNHNSVIIEFLNVLDQDKYILVDRDEIEKSCFDIEFGYYDLNAGTSNTSKHFTKAWKIKLSNRDYPYAYINDMNSDVISYDNGIRYY